MKKEKALTYKEAYEFALQHYDNGGDFFVECVSEMDYKDHVQAFGGMTKTKMLKEFSMYLERSRGGY